MNMIEAIAFLQDVKTVGEWNAKREVLKQSLSPEQIAQIDGSGIIVKILGRDKA